LRVIRCALDHLLKEKKLRVEDFAGACSMSDEEEVEILRDAKEARSRWKFQKG
jgi:hypothetical protein